MNKKFTKLIAALALLVFMTPSMAGWGQTYTELFSISSADVVTNSSYTAYTTTVSDRNWVVTFGGNNKSVGTNSSNRSNCNLGSYTKYAVSPVTSTQVASAFACTSSLSNVGKIKYTFNGGSNQTSTKVYLLYSANDGTYSQVSLTSGTQGASISSGTEYTFSASTGYFALLFEATNTSGNWRIDDVSITFYQEGASGIYTLNSVVTPTGTGTVELSETSLEEGETATATATANAHYTFTSWSIAGEGATLSSTTTNPTTVTMGTANATITATFTEDPKYNITYNPNYEGSTDEPVVVSDYAGQTMTIADYSTFSRTGFILTSWNTQADGTGTSYNAGDSYTMTSTGLTLYAQWEVSYETVDELTYAFTGISGSSYAAWSNKTGASGAVYAGRSGGNYSTIQLNNSSPNGIVSTTSGGRVTKVVITWNSNTSNGRSVDIYGSNTAYEGSADLYDTNKQGTKLGSIVKGTSTTLTISGDYTYIGIRNPGSAVYLDKVEITWSTAPSTDPSVTAEDVEIAYDATSGSIMGEIVNYVEGTVSATTDADWISNFTYDQADEIFEVDFAATVNPSAVARTANVTLTFTYGNNETTTKNVTVSQTGNPNGPGTQNNPYTVAQAIDAIDNNGNVTNVYATGVVSQVTYFSQTNHYITYYISADGSTTGDQLEAYRGKGIDGADFSSIDDIQVGDVVVIKGNLMYYSQSSTYEFAENNQLVSLVRPDQYTLTAAMTNVAEYFVFVGSNEIEFDNNHQAQVRAGATVYVSLTMEDCYSLTSLTVNGSTTGVTEIEPGIYYSFVMPEGDATIGVSATQATQYTLTVAGLNNVTYTDILAGLGSEEVTLTNNQATLCEGINVDIVGLTANAGLSLQSVTLNDGTTTTTLELENGVYHFTMPSSNATLTFTTTTAPTYTLATTIESGKIYIISNGTNRAMGKQNGTLRSAAAVSIEDGIATANTDVYEFEITGSATAGYTIYDVKDHGYLYASSSDSNNIGTRENNDDDNSMWTITFDGNSVTITANGSNTRNSLRYNYNQGNERFTCYGSNSNVNATLYLYVKDETPATETYTLTINGYGSSTNEGWNLIASPVAVDPADVEGMTIESSAPNYSDFDLYYFDQTGGTTGKEWKNYKANGFDLVPGKGYLYANKGNVNNNPNTVTLTFEGVPYSGNGEVELDYSEDNQDVNMRGWNLIGNPFSTAATLNMPFFKMNGTGSGFTSQSANSSVAAMEGVLVYAYDDDASQPIATATFTAADRSNSESAAMVNIDVVSSFGAVMDNAIVNFNEGLQLPKFYFGTQNANIYIPQGNKEYAIVNTEAQGEKPVNFKAAENGTYTLSISTEGVEMNYLHLIDNKTGANIDLLQAPSYTFNASVNDYESRFRLVFAANNSTTDNSKEDAFAFFSDGSWVINNEGEATLQVIDVTGRVLSSETVNGSVSKVVNAASGVYMLRLTNGDSVKVQKIVVR